MLGAHEYESYGSDRDPHYSSRLKKLARKFGKTASQALNALGSIPSNLLDSGSYVDQQENWGGKAEQADSREVILPEIYDHENDRVIQPDYKGRVYDKKGESMVPLEYMLEDPSLLVVVYELNNESARRYVILQRVPDLLGDGEPIEDLVKFSVVYERTDISANHKARFTCRSARDIDLLDPQLTEALVIGGNYGNNSRLAMVMTLTPQHDKPPVSLDGDLSSSLERRLAYSVYGVEDAISRYQSKQQLSKSE